MKSPLKTIRLLIESLVFAFKSVIVNRLRTILSLLGITIGIFAIISVFTIFDSLEINIRDSLAEAGSNVIYIQKWPWAMGDEDYPWWKYWNRPIPKYREYARIKEQSQLSEAVCFWAFSRRSVKFGKNTADNTTIWGTTEEFTETRDHEIGKGRFFSPFEFQASRNVAVIGFNLAEELFQGLDPVGRQIKIGGHRATIVGLFEREGNSFFGGGSLDEFVVVPMQFMAKIADIRSESADPLILARAKPNVSNAELKAELRQIMRAARRLKPRAEDNFALNETSILSRGLDQIFGVMNTVGFFIGIFSILVGGFGIANIMFVSVKERTNVIGIQKALGAKRYFILWQFLFESMMLAVTGGAVGLIIVLAGTLVVSRFIENFTFVLTFGNIALGLTVSAAIGIVSGFAPAWSAARMNPVEAINTTF